MSSPYYWFQGKSVQELFRRLYRAGPDARLEVHFGDNMAMHFIVKGGTDAVLDEEPPINDSHICPPFC